MPVYGMKIDRKFFEKFEDQVKAVLDFLEYDARVRKIDDRKRFEARTEELKRRFEPTLKRLLEHMQKSPQPRLMPAAPGEAP